MWAQRIHHSLRNALVKGAPVTLKISVLAVLFRSEMMIGKLFIELDSVISVGIIGP